MCSKLIIRNTIYISVPFQAEKIRIIITGPMEVLSYRFCKASNTILEDCEIYISSYLKNFKLPFSRFGFISCLYEILPLTCPIRTVAEISVKPEFPFKDFNKSIEHIDEIHISINLL